MTIQLSTLNKLKKLESLYNQGYRSDIVDQALDKIIALESAKTRQKLDDLRAKLIAFEREYQMSSERFYERFHAGELGDGVDFFEWSALYDLAETLSERLQRLAPETA